MSFKSTVKIGVITMGIFSAVAALFSGCANRHDNVVLPTDKTERPFSRISSVPIPEGVKLTGMFITHQGGMRAAPYYIMQTTSEGVYLKTSDLSPSDSKMTEGEDIASLPSNARYLGFADTVKECEYASSVLIGDDAPLKEIEACIAEYGALSWDGYDENVSMKGISDSGDRYQLYLELSDGTTVTVNGYNVCPAGFKPLLKSVGKVFEQNSDYSRYMAKSLTDSPCVTLFASFKGGMRTEYRLELTKRDSRWIAVLNDPNGSILEKGTDISDYGDMKGELPFGRFIAIMQRHNAEKWNGYYAADANSADSFTVRLTFEDGKKFEISGNVLPDGFEKFKTDFITEMYRFYSEVKP